MSNNTNNQRKVSYTALGLAAGVAFGLILGLIANNIILFGGGCLLLGLAAGAALDRTAR